MKERFKFKELKAYGSLESLFQGNRKYRIVYDEAETSYINAELSVYNLLFQESETWDISVVFKAFNHHTGREICSLEKKATITPDDNIVYVREGWGTPDPGFWKKGIYRWEAQVDGVKIGEAWFYMVNNGLVSTFENPYFNIKSIKLYESPFEGMVYGSRKYLQTFDHKITRYLNAELILENKLSSDPHFPLELQFNIYNDSRQLKAHMVYFQNIYDQRSEIILDSGYGTRAPGYWYKDNYTIEVVFMDTVIAVVPFKIDETEVLFEGQYESMPNEGEVFVQQQTAEAPLSIEEARAELDGLIGLDAVKKQINDLAAYIKFIQLRTKKGFTEKQNFNLHAVFTGNPGTGKTTVARALGKIYKALGVLKDGKVHEVGRADLVAEYIGQTAPKTKKAIEQAKGGILFIDEAYSLTNRGDDGKDFGKEVIEVLLKEMSDGAGDFAVVCAGYPQEMQHFIDSNPGLGSRFGHYVNFPDYTPDELMEIVEYASISRDVKIADDALKLIHRQVVESYRGRNRKFGNARYINGIVEEAKKNMGIRLMQHENPDELNEDELSTIGIEDVTKVFERQKKKGVKLPIDEPQLTEALTELHTLIGLDNIKAEVSEIVKLVRYYHEVGKDVREAFSLHTVFTGNPGTGKTTVARILVRIYKALGILERGHMVEVDRKDLVAGYVGQTAIKTNMLIDDAMGGGLFIDEAYALSNRGRDGGDFGREVIEVLLKRMEDDRGKFMVIVAGYTQEMKQFIESNPGLKSRFDKVFHFNDYTCPELMQVAELIYAETGLKLDDAARTYFEQYVNSLLKAKNKYFGNARSVRKIAEESTRKQHLRLASLPAAARTPEAIQTITVDDLRYLETAEIGQQDDNNRIGFKN
jgi:SpoVK/Ycf46/Vps4 family AAA+-type ATPase